MSELNKEHRRELVIARDAIDQVLVDTDTGEPDPDLGNGGEDQVKVYPIDVSRMGSGLSKHILQGLIGTPSSLRLSGVCSGVVPMAGDAIQNVAWMFLKGWPDTLAYLTVRSARKKFALKTLYGPSDEGDRDAITLSTPTRFEWSILVDCLGGRAIARIEGSSGALAANYETRVPVTIPDGKLQIWFGSPDHTAEGGLEIPNLGWVYEDVKLTVAY